jgi:hypothetical protein
MISYTGKLGFFWRRLKMKKHTSIIAAIAAIAILLPILASAESDSCRINRERKAIGRALVEVQSTNWPSIMQYYTYDIEYHDPIVTIMGIETMTEFLARMFTNSPDLVTTIEDETCINGIYSASWVMEGQFDGVPYSAPGVSIIKFRPGETQAYYQRDYYTEGDIMINIPGLDEPTAAFRTYYQCAVDPTFDCPFGQAMARAFGDEEIALKSESPQAGAFKLQQNVPNPFNPSTKISFEVPAGGGKVNLQIFDVTGRLVRTLVDGFESAGTRTVTWNGRTDQGQPAASGIYYYRLTGPSFTEQKKMVLLK